MRMCVYSNTILLIQGAAEIPATFLNWQFYASTWHFLFRYHQLASLLGNERTCISCWNFFFLKLFNLQLQLQHRDLFLLGIFHLGETCSVIGYDFSRYYLWYHWLFCFLLLIMSPWVGRKSSVMYFQLHW